MNEFMKYSSGVILSWFKNVYSWIPKSTMVHMYLKNGHSPPSMTCLDFWSNTIYVSRYLHMIISYLLSTGSSLWHSHVSVFVEMKSVRKIFTFTLLLAVIFPTFVCHFITAYVVMLSFGVSLIVTIVELHLLSNRIQESL